jgi:hypothetical protein
VRLGCITLLYLLHAGRLQKADMFELLHHAMHMKAHFTTLMPEEDRHDYIQPHNPGICTQFRVRAPRPMPLSVASFRRCPPPFCN